MNRTIRTIGAIAIASLAFQATLAAGPKATRPPTMTAVKPTAPTTKPAKPVNAPTMKSTAATADHGPQMKSAKAGAPAAPAKPTTKTDVKAAKSTAASAKATAKADTKLAKSTAKTDAQTSKHSSTTATGSSTTTTAASTDAVVVSTPLADKISRNPKLAAKIASRLPSDMTLAQASAGFRNQGQFLAAVNVSRNLGIDFVKLQTAMTGQTVTVDPKTDALITKPTGDAPVSLGRAIQTLKPGADADAAVQTAQAQTSAMVQSSSATTATPGAATHKKTVAGH